MNFKVKLAKASHMIGLGAGDGSNKKNANRKNSVLHFVISHSEPYQKKTLSFHSRSGKILSQWLKVISV